jgi:hypothetical protein
LLDDADRYGTELTAIVRELILLPRPPLILITMRSGRGVDRFADRADAVGIAYTELAIPDLSDPDITAILDVLSDNNRLGVLRGEGRRKQVSAFRDVARRQIIVALLEATSGRRFEDLIISELVELPDDTRALYSIAAVASALRFGLSRDELLLAMGDMSNATLSSIDALQRVGLLVLDDSDDVRVRHRVIADVLMRQLAKEGLLGAVITGLAVAAATKLTPSTPRHHRYSRRMRSLMNHDWLVQQLRPTDTRAVYEDIESLLQWHHHYWLQRGSFELEHGDLHLAENFINQAYSLSPDDALVLTEYAYLQLRLAVAEPASGESRRLLREGFDLLSDSIKARRGADPHQYHIFGRQGLEWLRRGDVLRAEREAVLAEIAAKVDEGRKVFPRNEPLRELYVHVQNDRLGVASTG